MMTKEELHALAAPGVAQKVAAMELELATYQKEWPELFISPTAPQLLKLPRRNGHNGHWPIVVTKQATKLIAAGDLATEADHAPTTVAAEFTRRKLRASWTPARRAKMARLMKKRQKALHAGKKKATKKAAADHQPLGDRIHAYLTEHGVSDVHIIRQALHVKASTSVTSALDRGLIAGRFVRVAKGRYAVGDAT